MPDKAYISSVEVKKKKEKKEKIFWTSFLKRADGGRSQEGGELRLACDCAMKESCRHLKSWARGEALAGCEPVKYSLSFPEGLRMNRRQRFPRAGGEELLRSACQALLEQSKENGFSSASRGRVRSGGDFYKNITPGKAASFFFSLKDIFDEF